MRAVLQREPLLPTACLKGVPSVPMSDLLMVGIMLGFILGVLFDRMFLPAAARVLVRHGWR